MEWNVIIWVRSLSRTKFSIPIQHWCSYVAKNKRRVYCIVFSFSLKFASWFFCYPWTLLPLRAGWIEVCKKFLGYPTFDKLRAIWECFSYFMSYVHTFHFHTCALPWTIFIVIIIYFLKSSVATPFNENKCNVIHFKFVFLLHFGNLILNNRDQVSFWLSSKFSTCWKVNT